METMLRDIYGENASFRPGQREAIEAVLSGKRTLVVQKTGWGKSLVYFLATKILRGKGNGPAIIISPLLSLINNQIESAKKFGLHVVTINSENTDDWNDTAEKLLTDYVDILFISPERLANERFKTHILTNIQHNISMLVIDEAHCISDWGYDFRPDYLRIKKIIQMLPQSVPFLATTATANNRVIEDIVEQFGGKITVLRGELTRENLRINILRNLGPKAARLAWLDENLEKMRGTGIIYCLTTKDCDIVCKWLNKKEHNVVTYYSGNKSKEEKEENARKFYNNEVKAVVATVALGMGIDKSDIDFVIHFQQPGNLIEYYQQIGRAGRGGKPADVVLLLGEEDDIINNYFINSAFPSEDQMESVIEALSNSNGMKKADLLAAIDITSNKMDQILKLLLVHGIIYHEDSMYYKSANKWQRNFTHAQEITNVRQTELQQMKDFVSYSGCYMEYITKTLDDEHAHPCQKCGNCAGVPFSDSISEKTLSEVKDFLCHENIAIEPRKQWADNKRIPALEQMQPGVALCNYGDIGWGQMVKNDKYLNKRFSQVLINASAELLQKYCKEWKITVVTAIPSRRRPHLVPDFAEALAKKLGLPYIQYLEKVLEAKEQKTLNNSVWQSRNANVSFEVIGKPSGRILLVDDMVDSRWTLTVCASKMLQAGADKVYPFALANV